LARAADRTWNGGGADNNWSTGANWGGSAPAAGDALFFGGSAKPVNTNDVDGLSVLGLTFNSGAGAFTLRGSSLTLDGDLVNFSASAPTLDLPLVLSGTRKFYGSNVAMTVNGTLSGAGGLIASVTNNVLKLVGNNSYEGVTTVTNGGLWITHASALGSTNGNTVVRSLSGAYLNLSGGIAVAEPLTLVGERPNYGSTLISSSGSNVLSGPVTKVGQNRLNSSGGATLSVTGGITGSGGLLVINSSGTIAFYNTPLSIGTDQFYTDSDGLTVMAVAGNTWGDTLVANGTMRMEVANGLPAATVLKLGVGYGPSGTFDLNGNNQTVGQLRNETANAGTRTVTSATPATLTVNQTATSTYDGRLTGALSLVKTGSGSLMLSNNLSTTTGHITVSNGTLIAALASSLGLSTNVTVAGGTLELRAASTISDSAVLTVADGGAKVKINAGINESVYRLALGGVGQPSGTYGATGSGAATIDDAHFSGTGLLTVLSNPPVVPVTATWDGEAADLNVSSPTNWAGDLLPAFDGATYAVFGTGGATAAVDRTIGLYGMAFNRSANFVIAAGAGIVSNGAGGILAQVPDATSRTYTLAEDVVLADSQKWTVTNNAAGVTTLSVPGAIDDGTVPCNLIKEGNGVLVLSGNNTYDGATTVRTGGVVRVTSGAAFGSTNGATTVENGGWVEMSGGINLTESLGLYGDASTSYQGVLRSTGGSNTLSGLVINGSRIRCTSGSLDIVGGVTGGQFVLGCDGSTFIRVSEKPIAIGGNTFYAHTGALIILGVANNTWGTLEVSGNYLRTDVAGALAPAGVLILGSGSPSGVNLNGNSQTVGRLDCAATTPGTRLIYSAAPATLTVNQSANSTFNGAITGRVNVVKGGSYNLLLSNTNTTYGSFVVSNGTLTVGSTGTLGANTAAVIVNGGTLTLSNSVAIADSASLSVADGGGAKVNLAAGVNEAVSMLYLGGKQKRVGTYGSTSSAAAVKDDVHFSGAGILTVLRDDFGTLISVR
jgi:autotransporter-associated beta strand protein